VTRRTNPILKRASVARSPSGASLPVLLRRPTPSAADATGCDTAMVYGLGVRSLADCKLGSALTHSGGFPGYGSNVLMLPERGLAVFAFSNVTYGPDRSHVRLAARSLVDSGAFPLLPVRRATASSPCATSAARIYASGDVLVAREALAMNLLLDRDAARRNADLAKLKAELGACAAPESLTPTTALQGEAVWRCERGRPARSAAAGPDRAAVAAGPRLQQGGVTPCLSRTDRSRRHRVEGEAARPFLHNLLTQDVESLAPGESRYAALLTPQGRILHDMLLVGAAEGILLDVAASAADDLIRPPDAIPAARQGDDHAERAARLGVMAPFAWAGSGRF
jgi:hypothetical protein